MFGVSYLHFIVCETIKWLLFDKLFGDKSKCTNTLSERTKPSRQRDKRAFVSGEASIVSNGHIIRKHHINKISNIKTNR